MRLKTLAEIAIEAGLVTKDNAVKAGRIAAQRQEPLVSVLIRELGVDEVALIGALRKQTRVPLIDPADVEVDPDALRVVSRDVCHRLRVLPLQVGTEGQTKVLRIAMADPTDASAILELEHITHCEIEVTALPLSAIEELVDKGYKAFSTAVVPAAARAVGGVAQDPARHRRRQPARIRGLGHGPDPARRAARRLDPRARSSPPFASCWCPRGCVTADELAEALKKGPSET